MNIVKMGVFLKECRTQLKLTQSEVAQRIGISPQAISKWEKGDNLPDVTYFPDIAKIYNISISELLEIGSSDEKDEKAEVFNIYDISIPLFDNTHFTKILTRLTEVDEVAELSPLLTFDFFPYLGTIQKTSLLEILLTKPDATSYLDEILPYATTNNKAQILGYLIEVTHYAGLELLLPFLNNEMRQTVLNKLLYDSHFEMIEDMITLFNKKHRDTILSFFISNHISNEVVENFLPFFDKNQLKKLNTTNL